jgi:hypothetical protein
MSNLGTPGLVPSWPRNGRYDSNSSPTGAYSSSSSEAGDDLPRTPITPAHQVASDPFLATMPSTASSVKESKENVAPTLLSAGQAYGYPTLNAQGMPVIVKGVVHNNAVPMATYAAPAARPVLHVIHNGQQQQHQPMPRPLRRLSN